MKKVIAILLFFVGLIHLFPVAGAAGTAKLQALYGVPIHDPNLEILMRHRAILFGLLGFFICYAAFRPKLQSLALTSGLVSAGAFVWIAWGVGSYNRSIGKVIFVDLIALGFLIMACILYYLQKRTAGSS